MPDRIELRDSCSSSLAHCTSPVFRLGLLWSCQAGIQRGRQHILCEYSSSALLQIAFIHSGKGGKKSMGVDDCDGCQLLQRTSRISEIHFGKSEPCIVGVGVVPEEIK